jgi:hypothetical protein
MRVFHGKMITKRKKKKMETILKMNFGHFWAKKQVSVQKWSGCREAEGVKG